MQIQATSSVCLHCIIGQNLPARNMFCFLVSAHVLDAICSMFWTSELCMNNAIIDHRYSDLNSLHTPQRTHNIDTCKCPADISLIISRHNGWNYKSQSIVLFACDELNTAEREPRGTKSCNPTYASSRLYDRRHTIYLTILTQEAVIIV